MANKWAAVLGSCERTKRNGDNEDCRFVPVFGTLRDDVVVDGVIIVGFVESGMVEIMTSYQASLCFYIDNPHLVKSSMIIVAHNHSLRSDVRAARQKIRAH